MTRSVRQSFSWKFPNTGGGKLYFHARINHLLTIHTLVQICSAFLPCWVNPTWGRLPCWVNPSWGRLPCWVNPTRGRLPCWVNPTWGRLLGRSETPIPIPTPMGLEMAKMMLEMRKLLGDRSEPAIFKPGAVRLFIHRSNYSFIFVLTICYFIYYLSIHLSISTYLSSIY